MDGGKFVKIRAEISLPKIYYANLLHIIQHRF
jgi:hypothetical protein